MVGRAGCRRGPIGLVGAAAVVSLVLSACSSSSLTGSPTSAPASSRAGSSPATASAQPADPAAAFFAKVRQGSATLTSARLDADFYAVDQPAGQSVEVKVSGVQTFRRGDLQAQRLTVRLGKSRGDVISVGHRTWVRMAGDKKWAPYPGKNVSADADRLVEAYLLVTTFCGPQYVAGLEGGASDLRRRLPTETPDEVPVTPYAFAVDPAKVSAGAQLLPKVAPPGVNVETTVELDAQGHVATIDQYADADGRDFNLDVTYDALNARVRVSAPPAGETSS